MGKTIDIVFGVKGGADINGESGDIILRQLQGIASAISNNPAKRDMLVLGVNPTKTKALITQQLNSIINNLKLNPINLQLLINGQPYNGGGGGGSGGSANRAANMVNEVENYIKRNAGALTQDEVAKAKDLADAMNTQGANLDELNRRWKTYTTDTGVAMKERAEYHKGFTKLLSDQEKAEEKNQKAFDAEIRASEKAAEKQQSAFLKTKEAAGSMADTIIRTTSSFREQGLLDGNNGYMERISNLYDKVVAAGESGNQEALKQLKSDWADLTKEVSNYKSSLTTDLRQSRIYEDATNYMKKFGDILKEQDPEKYEQLVGIIQKLRGQNLSTTELKKLETELGILKSEADTALTSMQRLWNGFKARLKSMALTAAVLLLRKALRQLYNNVVDLDKAVTDLQIASGKTRTEVEAMVHSYSKLAKELGVTTTEVAQGADTWLRQGYSAAEAETLLANSTKLAVLGQMDAKEASTALTSAMKGYKVSVEDAINIVDKFTAVDMKAAASAGDIATAMSETAVSANVAGVSMDKLIGYLTVVKEVTQDGAESVGKELPNNTVMYCKQETISVKVRRRIRPRKVA